MYVGIAKFNLHYNLDVKKNELCLVYTFWLPS